MKNASLLGLVATVTIMLLAGVANADVFGISRVLADPIPIVPEPASLSLLAIGGLALLLRRRK